MNKALKEEWRDIEGTFGQYQVSNTGKIRSVLLLKSGYRYNILKSQRDKKGYERVSVTVKRQKKTFKIHREVAKAFLDNPCKLPQVNHIDGNKSNNNVLNLEWVTNSYNAIHALKLGLWDSVLKGAKEENEKRKKPVLAININTGEVTKYDSISECEKAIGTKHVCAVLKGRRKTAQGYLFKYI